jgi:hypothetical protein
MWIFTVYGFFSISVPKNDKTVVVVRARMPDHLENLRKRFPANLGSLNIADSSNTDYRYRMVVPKIIWEATLLAIQSEQDWDNFKDKVKENKEHVSSGYEFALHRIWAVMFRLQPLNQEAPIDNSWLHFDQQLAKKSKRKKKAKSFAAL